MKLPIGFTFKLKQEVHSMYIESQIKRAACADKQHRIEFLIELAQKDTIIQENMDLYISYIEVHYPNEFKEIKKIIVFL